MNKWRVTMAQVASKPLDVEANGRLCMKIMDECAPGSLLVLPEMFLSGYEIEDALFDEKFAQGIDAGLESVRKHSAAGSVDLLISYPLLGGKKPYIALEYISQGRTVALHRKINLCNYAQYREHLVFDAGDEIVTAKTDFGTAGLFVCEDLWHITNAVFAARRGAEVLFYPSAATVMKKEDGPGCLQNWKYLTQGTAFSQTSYVVCCNLAADGKSIYMGGSHIVSPDGCVVCEFPLFDEHVAHFYLDMDYLAHIRQIRPLLSNERFQVYRKYL